MVHATVDSLAFDDCISTYIRFYRVLFYSECVKVTKKHNLFRNQHYYSVYKLDVAAIYWLLVCVVLSLVSEQDGVVSHLGAELNDSHDECGKCLILMMSFTIIIKTKH